MRIPTAILPLLLLAGFAYTASFPEFLFISMTSYGPSGGGINVPSTGGNNVGLGKCAIGFNGQPVLVWQGLQFR